MPLTAEIITRLEAIGIRDPAGSSWQRVGRQDSRETVIHSSWAVCWCLGYPIQISGRPFTHDGRRIIIRQCPHCGTITWTGWRMDGVWTGPEEIRAEEISPKGAVAQASIVGSAR